MPSVSGAQHRAMEAAAHGHSTLGIPKSVGQEFAGADKGHHFNDDALAKLDAAIARFDAFVSRVDDLGMHGFNEADHPRDESGKFTTQGGAAAHGIASYKKSLGWSKKPTGSGLMQHMIKTGHYSEKDIAAAWKQMFGGTTAGAVKGQISIMKKAGHNPPPLPYTSTVPDLKAQAAASTPTVAAPASQTLEASHPVSATEHYQALGQQILANAQAQAAAKATTPKLSEPPSKSAFQKSMYDMASVGNLEGLHELIKSAKKAGLTQAESYGHDLLSTLGAPGSKPAPSHAAPAAAILPASDYAGAKEKILGSPEAKEHLETLFQNWDVILPENQAKVEPKLIELANAIGNPDKIAALEPIAVGYGKSISSVNAAIAALKGPEPVTSIPAPAPKSNIVKAPESKRMARMVETFKNAKRFHSTSDEASKVVCPSLKQSFWTAVSPDVKASAKSYTGGGYGEINSALRTWETKNASPHVVQKINHIEDLFEHDDAILKEDTVLKRGEDVPAGVVEKWEAALKAGLPCRYMKDGFVSASMASKAAFSGKNVIFEIVARKGTKALGLDTISSHSENEVLLRHGQNFEIFEIERNSYGNATVRMVSI